MGWWGAQSQIPTAIQLWELLSPQDKNMERLSLAAPFWAKTLEETHVGPV